jgi:hypothetical protein
MTHCISPLYNHHKLNGNIIPHSWYQTITTKRGIPDLITISLLSEIVYWYRPKPIIDEETGTKKYVNKFFGNAWQTSYNHFEKKFNFSHETIRRSFVKLEHLGFIKREFKTVSLRGQQYNNVLFIHLNLQVQTLFSHKNADTINTFNTSDVVTSTSLNHKSSNTSFFKPIQEDPSPQIVGDNNIDIKNNNKKDRSTGSNFFEKNSEDSQNLQESRAGVKLTKIEKTEYPEKSFTKITTAIEPFNTTSRSESWAKRWFGKRLSDFHPLNEEDAEVLIKESGREFNLNFINQLLLKLSEKCPEHTFCRKRSFFNYMIKVLSNEMRQTTQVNNEGFQFRKEGPEYEMDKYLEKVEYSRETTKEAQLRRKVAAVFGQDTAYKLLLNSKFEVKQESKKNDEEREKEETSVLHLKLSQKILLTESQKTMLLEQGRAVYGDIDKVRLHPSSNSSPNYVDNANVDNAESCITNVLYEFSESAQDQLCGAEQGAVWDKVRLSLREAYGPGVDQSWFGKLIAEEDEVDKKIILKAPTTFIRDWIQQHYQYVIEQFCTKQKYQLQEVGVI